MSGRRRDEVDLSTRPGAKPTAAQCPPASRAAAGLATLALTTVLWMSAGMYALGAVAPANPITHEFLGQPDHHVVSLIPQGWAFFTRDPREPSMFAYQKGDGDWLRRNAGAVSQWRFALGLNRAGRAQAVEFMMFDSVIDDWVDCTGPPEDCAAAVEAAGLDTVVLEPSPLAHEPTICGEVLVVVREQVPFAWRQGVLAEEMRARAAPILVECP